MRSKEVGGGGCTFTVLIRHQVNFFSDSLQKREPREMHMNARDANLGYRILEFFTEIEIFSPCTIYALPPRPSSVLRRLARWQIAVENCSLNGLGDGFGDSSPYTLQHADSWQL